MKMPNYTLEEKARAFDALWRGCSDGGGEFIEYKMGSIRRVDRNESAVERIPVHEFRIRFPGYVDTFGDVLRELTQEKAPTDEGRG